MSDAITARECGKCKLPQYPRACRCEVEELGDVTDKLRSYLGHAIDEVDGVTHLFVSMKDEAYEYIVRAESLLRKRGDDE